MANRANRSPAVIPNFPMARIDLAQLPRFLDSRLEAVKVPGGVRADPGCGAFIIF